MVAFFDDDDDDLHLKILSWTTRGDLGSAYSVRNNAGHSIMEISRRLQCSCLTLMP